MRKGAHEAVNKVVAHGLDVYQISEALTLARSGLQSPAAWDAHLRRATASLMLSSMYGERPVSLFPQCGSWSLAHNASSKVRKTLAFFTLALLTSISHVLRHLGHTGYVTFLLMVFR